MEVLQLVTLSSALRCACSPGMKSRRCNTQLPHYVMFRVGADLYIHRKTAHHWAEGLRTRVALPASPTGACHTYALPCHVLQGKQHFGRAVVQGQCVPLLPFLEFLPEEASVSMGCRLYQLLNLLCLQYTQKVSALYL